ncbi:MAG: class I tRNA ligase family protein [Spirochaetes bacterium]|nr:class I tRNA ligase family protein [Spirochaetota bacterium]
MLELYNTMSRSQEVFRPRRKGVVKIFTCGPSIYRRPHIGNYRTFIYEDILVKYLEYLGYEVGRALPLTDIEDKTILEAIRKRKKIDELTADVEKIFMSESRSLGIRLPRKAERASHCVDCSARIIKKLIDTGHAYRHGRDIFFDPRTYREFGKLFRLDMSRWPKRKIRFRRDTYNGNRWNLGDFILWHGYREGDIKWWDTVIGRGRPSWNIQDPSVIIQRLGPEIDINCGGIDNIYRHHDYNIAIVESYSGRRYANYYLHGQHLVVEGKPMSKSRGNILYPDNVYRKGCTAAGLRYFLFYTHYRKKLNFTRERFKASCERIGVFRAMSQRLMRPRLSAADADPRVGEAVRGVRREFEKGMNNDLNIGAAFDGMFAMLLKLDSLKDSITASDARELRKIMSDIDAVAGVIL